MFDPTTLNDFQLQDVSFGDKHADAYVDWAEHADGTELTESELDWLNDNCADWIFEQAMEACF